jgi:acetoin utilization deacetylase AcuC-like enzyme
MKVVFHDKYFSVYSGDPASAEGRLDSTCQLLKQGYPFAKPEPASEDDLLLAHARPHIEHVKADAGLYEIACLAAGGAILASEIALAGEPAFGLIRPPGHHASPSSCWGSCYFNNMAIAIRRLLDRREIGKALIVDFDLHFGDGTSNTFAGDQNVAYHHMGSDPRELERFLSTVGQFDILGVSAGFDRGVADWGSSLNDADYEEIGALLKHFSDAKTQSRRFSVLEGGYNHKTLGNTVASFLEAFA